MSADKEDTLSPDELRKRLYQTFKSKGLLDTLKTQLRNQLIQELKHAPSTGGEWVPRALRVRSEGLLASACNSIVADHLSASGYEYTLSVFYPESGQSKDKVLTREDLLHLLKIRPESTLYRSLSTDDKDNKDKAGFLISLLKKLTSHYTDDICHDAGTQTTSIASYGESLVEKMKMIDKEYESFSQSGDKWFSFQSQLAAYRKEIEAQLEAEMNTKLQHFKSVEIAKVKMEEKSNFHREFDKLKQQLERNYEMKTKALMDREKNAIDRLQKQQEIEEKNVYLQRQSVLKEIETARNRESDLRMRTEAFEKTCQIHEEKVKATEQLLRSRELAAKTLEDTHDQRLRSELSRYENELKEEFIERTEKLTENENQNKAETARIQRESAGIDSKLEEHSRACSQLRRLQVELDTARQQVALLTQQTELLRERLQSTSDYPGLKREKGELQGQLRLLKAQLDEAQEENRLLHADLGKPSKEHLAWQAELRRLQSARRLEEEEFDHQRQVLQTQLQSEAERCAQLRAQLTEHEEKSQWLKTHAEDIQAQLRLTQQALENEVLRNPKPSIVDRSVLELAGDGRVPPDVYVDTALLRARLGYRDLCRADEPLRGHRSAWRDSPDSDMEEVAEAKARIGQLQREAETLEEAYRNYQQRAVRATISHMLPPNALSPPPPRPAHGHSPSPFADKSKLSRRPSSPRTARAPASSTHDTRSPTAPVQPRVTFLEAQYETHSAAAAERALHPWPEPLSLRDARPQDESSASSGRLTSASHSSRKKLRKGIAQEAGVPAAELPELSADGQLPPAPSEEPMTSGDFSSDFSPPRSPRLRSTARDVSSPPQMQPVFTSSQASTQPGEMSLQDLAGISTEAGHIPELLLDTAVPLAVEAPDGPAGPRPQDLPEDPTEMHGEEDAPQSARVEDEEAEEARWESERKERQERRRREQEEARERELQELERLEKETLSQEVEQPGQGEEGGEETGLEKGGGGERGEDAQESKGENPLEKYMKMVLEARETRRAQGPGGEEAGYTSAEAKSMSEEKEDSIAAYSHKEEDDDFW